MFTIVWRLLFIYIYISIWLLTYSTDVYTTLFRMGVLSITITLLSKSFKTVLVHDQIFAHFNLNRWWGREEEKEKYDDDYQYHHLIYKIDYKNKSLVANVTEGTICLFQSFGHVSLLMWHLLWVRPTTSI